MPGTDIQVSPFFLVGTKGNLFISAYYPLNFTYLPKKAIIHIPAFAEEMNKSRRMVAQQAREFAKNGYSVFILDLFGTGDSAGEFSEASWCQWKSDINSLCEWLQDHGYEVIDFWGLRLGTLLAMDFIGETEYKIRRLICWQPVFFGETFVMQFLRLRTAAAIMNQHTPQEKVSDLKKQLLDGQLVEVAGYMLNPELVRPILNLSMDGLNLQNISEILIFDIVNNLEKKTPATIGKLYDSFKQQIKKFSEFKVLGSPFWSTQEISEVPGLLNETINCMPMDD
jgi:exosortase A-associated hydrolase 2